MSSTPDRDRVEPPRAGSPGGPLAWLADDLRDLSDRGLLRRLRRCRRVGAVEIQCDGRRLINFGSNDYLSLAADPRLARAAIEAIRTHGWGAGASPLICGRTDLHAELERRLAEMEGAEAALLLPSGFAANSGVIPALGDKEDVLFADRKNHASIIDGCRLSRARRLIFEHADVQQLAELLDAAGNFRRRLIVTDGLFSMDGDLAPLAEIAELAERHEAMLLVDEAHATGVFGERGRGVSEYLGVEHRVPIRIGTLSKALGCAGGFVAGPQDLIDWLANRARSYVFSTAAPAASCAAAIAALDILRDEPERRRTLLARATDLRRRIRQAGWDTGGSESQIIPVMVGDADRVMQLAAELWGRGLFVPGIRPPSVPHGEALLRISLAYGHATEMIDQLVSALAELR